MHPRIRHLLLQLNTLEPRDLPAAPIIGSGSGLVAEMFADSQQLDLSKTLTATQLNADWGTDSPDASIPTDGFSVRWSGRVQAQFSEAYTFHLRNDDQAKLWINNELVIDDTSAGGTDEKSITRTLTAGETYSIRVEYTDVSGPAGVQLLWSSPSTSKTLIPKSQLYPTGDWISGYLNQDLGNTSQPGSFTSNDGVYTIRSNSSVAHFGYQSLTGDGVLQARLDAGSSGEVGLQFRDGLTADAKFVGIAFRNNTAYFQVRSAHGGSIQETPIANVSTPEWLHIVRRGNFFSAYVSETGAVDSWRLVGTARLDLNEVVQVGLIATNGSGQFRSVDASPTIPIGAGIDGLADYSRTTAFVDAMKTARVFGSPDRPWQDPVPLDANGQPTRDFGTVVMTGIPDIGGTYKLSFLGQATVTTIASNASIQNLRYDPQTNTTTADVVVANTPDNQLMLVFRNTRRTANGPTNSGVTNIQLIRPGYSANQTFTDPFVEQASRFNVLRFMDWSSTNNNPVRTWSERTEVNDSTQANEKGVAWEYVVQLSNEMNVDPWINIPLHANDDYIRQLAALLKNTLETDRVVYVEYSNEIWNFTFSQTRENMDAATSEIEAGIRSGNHSNLVLDPNTELQRRADGTFQNDYLFAMRRAARRTKEISEIFAQVWGAEEINSRVRVVLANQVVIPYLTEVQLEYLEKKFGAPNQWISSLAGAPYLYMHSGDTPGISKERVLELLNQSVDDMDEGELHRALNRLVGLATRYGLELTAYEAGPDTFGANNILAKRDANRDPGMRDLTSRYLETWFQHGAGQINWFVTGAGNYETQYGTWPLSENINQQVTPKIQGIDDVLHGPKVAITEGTPIPNTLDARDYLGQTNLDGSPYLRYVHTGNFVEYLIRAPETGNYKLILDGSTSGANEQVEISINGKVIRTVTFTNANGETNWTDTDAGNYSLQQGLNVVRVKTVRRQTGWNLRSLRFAAEQVSLPQTPQPVNQAPTITQAASANPTPVTGTTTTLAVRANDDGGEANLRYTWEAVGAPTGAVNFSANGTNTAKTTTASFTQAGNYTFRVTVSDGSLSVTSTIAVTVQQTLARLTVTLSDVTVRNGQTQQFTANAFDQFNQSMPTPTNVVWSRQSLSIGGTISSTGLYRAPNSGTLNETIRATVNGISATATVRVVAQPTNNNGSGNGLRGRYYDNDNFSNLLVTRNDATVDFNWELGSPDPSMGVNNFSIRWEGQVQAIEAGHYRFQTLSDDGVRLWVNGQLVIDNFTDHPLTYNYSRPVYMAAGQKMYIRLDYYERGGGAAIRLGWQRPGEPGYDIIPQSQLYSTPETGQVIQAESTTLNGAVVRSSGTGFTGSGYVVFQNGANSSVEWNVDVPRAGTYALRFRYANPGASKPMNIAVNGSNVFTNLSFRSTSDANWWDEVEVNVYLQPGPSKIRLIPTGTESILLDSLTVI